MSFRPISSIEHPGDNEPTEKQVIYAERVAKALGLDLPKEYTRSAYWKFINDNWGRYEHHKVSLMNESDYDCLPGEGYFC